MSYRDDHDAALARIDALQDEIRQLRARPARVMAPASPTPAKRRGGLWLVAGAGLLAAGGLFGATVATTRNPEPVDEEIIPDTSIERARFDLLQCVSQTEPPYPPVALTSDDASAVASCRTVLQEVVHEGWSPHELEILESWITAEEAMYASAGELGVYYGDQSLREDPAASPQLWRDYHRAHDAREQAIVEWRATY